MQWSTGLVYKKEEDVDLKESAIKLYKKNRCFVGRKLYCFTQYEKNYTQILQEEKYNQEILSWSVRISLPDHSFTTVKTGVSQYQVNFFTQKNRFLFEKSVLNISNPSFVLLSDKFAKRKAVNLT